MVKYVRVQTICVIKPLLHHQSRYRKSWTTSRSHSLCLWSVSQSHRLTTPFTLYASPWVPDVLVQMFGLNRFPLLSSGSSQPCSSHAPAEMPSGMVWSVRCVALWMVGGTLGAVLVVVSYKICLSCTWAFFAIMRVAIVRVATSRLRQVRHLGNLTMCWLGMVFRSFSKNPWCQAVS